MCHVCPFWCVLEIPKHAWLSVLRVGGESNRYGDSPCFDVSQPCGFYGQNTGHARACSSFASSTGHRCAKLSSTPPLSRLSSQVRSATAEWNGAPALCHLWTACRVTPKTAATLLKVSGGRPMSYNVIHRQPRRHREDGYIPLTEEKSASSQKRGKRPLPHPDGERA